MGSMRTTLWIAGFTLAAGCGKATVSGEVDAGADAGDDTTPPQVLTWTPDQDSTGVSVLTSIRVTFDEPLDPDTVSDQSVSMRTLDFYAGTAKIPGQVSYDPATYTVTFDPLAPLAYSANFTAGFYELNVGAVTDLAGNAFAGDIRGFRTVANQQVRSVNYDMATAAPVSYRRTEIDVNGYPTKELRYNTPGGNGVWFDDDDVIISRTDYRYDDLGQPVEQTIFSGPGPNATWNTDDDEASQRVVIEWTEHQLSRETIYDAAGTINQADDTIVLWATLEYTLGNPTRIIVYADPGPDGLWQQGDDDVPDQVSESTFNADNLRVRQINYSGPGLDGMWLVGDDDDISDYTDWEYDADGHNTRYIRYDDGGPDGFLVGDDVPGYYYDYAYDTSGFLVQEIYYNGPGGDAMWLMGDDDDIGSWTQYQRNAAGETVDQIDYSDPGADGMWMMGDDDLATNHEGYQYDADFLQTEYIEYGAGADTILGNGDDVAQDLVTTAYDSSGKRMRTLGFGDPGADGMLGSGGDDRMYSRVDFDTLH